MTSVQVSHNRSPLTSATKTLCPMECVVVAHSARPGKASNLTLWPTLNPTPPNCELSWIPFLTVTILVYLLGWLSASHRLDSRRTSGLHRTLSSGAWLMPILAPWWKRSMLSAKRLGTRRATRPLRRPLRKSGRTRKRDTRRRSQSNAPLVVEVAPVADITHAVVAVAQVIDAGNGRCLVMASDRLRA